MLNHWTTRRKASLVFHIGIVLIPLTFATISAATFWFGLFQDWWVAIPLVVAIDVLALLGLVFHIAGVPSPFQVLRHFLPLVSVVPLGIELYRLLAVHNDMLVSVAVSVLVTTVLTLIAWRCYVTIESLFADPAAAARERTLEQVRGITLSLLTAADMQAAIGMAVKDWTERTDIRLTASVPALTGDVMPAVSTQAVRAYADSNNVSERTVYRKLKAGSLSPADILGEEPS